MTIPNGQLTVTRTVCPECRKTVHAKVLHRDGRIYFEKHCPEHGVSESLVADDARAYLDAIRFVRSAWKPLQFTSSVEKGCPEDCGLCPDHEQHVCMPVLEITDHCDMECPICLVRNRHSWHITREEFNRILDRLLESEGSIDVLSLSGGEPTLHPQFRDLVQDCVDRRKILRVSLSTNGLRLARDPELREFLGSRNVVVSLQFDGSDPVALRRMRGGDVSAPKKSLLDDLTKSDFPCSLTFTLAGGLNEEGLAEAVDLLFARPNILSLMVQPLAFCGHGSELSPEDGQGPGQIRKVFIPEVTRLLEKHGKGRVSASDFLPLPCSHPNCFSLGFFLKHDDGGFSALAKLFDPTTYLDILKNRSFFGTDPQNFDDIQNAVYQLWSGGSGNAPDSKKALHSIKTLLRKIQGGGGFDASRNITIAERAMKSVFIHAFMDPGTFDIGRVRKCCQVYPLRDGRLVPICAYNNLIR